ncbi:hypothetical protein SADUNF_Sadunf14G0059900 [Salix dunnii]|uniref:Uncharacterized protein n=1 Tax=Salix dunnii TaxID=1413687 RepID=A0A835JKX6_9ROSI|nr:hypothetical protein SADUNF_Sadunf14G0059900 [Salix dunnii]
MPRKNLNVLFRHLSSLFDPSNLALGSALETVCGQAFGSGQAQSKVGVLAWMGFAALIMHIGVLYLFVNVFKCGLTGASIALGQVLPWEVVDGKPWQLGTTTESEWADDCLDSSSYIDPRLHRLQNQLERGGGWGENYGRGNQMKSPTLCLDGKRMRAKGENGDFHSSHFTSFQIRRFMFCFLDSLSASSLGRIL